jgi:outer membrane lipoprotein-sorting protein
MRAAATIAFGLTLLAAVPAWAGLSERDQADIARVEAYLNSMTSLKAKFLQIGPDGALSEGILWLRRPGRMRFEYSAPTPILVVADGLFLVFADTELGQVDRIPLASTPIAILVDDPVSLSGAVTVSAVERDPGSLRLTLHDAARPREGQIVLVFADGPLMLRQWRVIDARDQITSVSLSDMEINPPLAGGLFVVTDPAPDDASRRR